jgi:hypothetical protein
MGVVRHVQICSFSLDRVASRHKCKSSQHGLTLSSLPTGFPFHQSISRPHPLHVSEPTLILAHGIVALDKFVLDLPRAYLPSDVGLEVLAEQ